MPAALIIAGVIGFLLLANRAKAERSEPDQLPGGGDPWEVKTTQEAGGVLQNEVFAKQGSFGPHARIKVLVFKTMPNGQRVLLNENPSAPPEMRERARDDFGLLESPADFGASGG